MAAPGHRTRSHRPVGWPGRSAEILRPPPQTVRPKLATTLTGRRRTTSSPGTPLRLPNSSARSAPMYRAPIAVAARSNSAGSSAQLSLALDLDEPERRLLQVDAQGGPRIPGQGAALRRLAARVEHEAVAFDDEPHRGDQRSPATGQVGELAGPGAVAEELPDLRVTESGHARRRSRCAGRTPGVPCRAGHHGRGGGWVWGTPPRPCSPWLHVRRRARSGSGRSRPRRRRRAARWRRWSTPRPRPSRPAPGRSRSIAGSAGRH